MVKGLDTFRKYFEKYENILYPPAEGYQGLELNDEEVQEILKELNGENALAELMSKKKWLLTFNYVIKMGYQTQLISNQKSRIWSNGCFAKKRFLKIWGFPFSELLTGMIWSGWKKCWARPAGRVVRVWSMCWQKKEKGV